jgi:Flp pilus assembly protein protease CpaA
MISFSTEEIALITSLVGGVVGGFIAVSKLLLAAKDKQIESEHQEKEYWRNMAIDLLRTGEQGVKIVETAVEKVRER